MTAAAACPFCASTAVEGLFPVYDGRCITSDMKVVADASIRNAICRDCGSIFNGAGVRGKTEDFYRDAYSLRMQSTTAKNVNFSSGAAVPLADLQLDFLRQALSDQSRTVPARLLEIGAGKGEFLSRSLPEWPDCEATGIEPSSAADILAARLPQLAVHRASYQSFVKPGLFDVIVSLGVVEHVERPGDFLTWIRGRLEPDGVVLLTFPDFQSNPGDLFCIDHLSKLTLASLNMMAEASGLRVLRTQRAGVMMMAALVAGPVQPIRNVYAQNEPVARRNEQIARDALAATVHAQEAAAPGRFAIYGLGMAGIFAPLFADFDPQSIAAYLDDNATMHGAVIHGRPVHGLDALPGLGVRRVVLAASPVYHPQMKAKLAKLGLAALDVSG
jgi:2-polyprenyl-3-methyl-5-hydroxy-6-metoxy-1,4-benzoquinol methylase